MPWRILLDAGPTAAHAIALDEVLLHSVGQDPERPALRCYFWPEPAITISRTQQYADIEQSGYPVIRRLSNGRALFHGKGDLTYSIIAPQAWYQDEGETYERVYQAPEQVGGLRGFFNSLGMPTTHVRGTVLTGTRKVSGSAQARPPDSAAFYQHGSILAYGEAEDRAGILSRIHRTPVSPGQIASVHGKMPDNALLGLLEVELVSGVVPNSTHATGWERSELTADEADRLHFLVETKYGTDAWTQSGTKVRGSCELTRGALPD